MQRWPTLPVQPFPSAGHGAGGWMVELRLSSDLAEDYERLPGQVSVEPGAVAAAFHTTAEGEPGPVFVMEKLQDGSWDFLALDAGASVLPSSDPTLCQRCHTEAPSGSLFGVPAGATWIAPAGAGGAEGAGGEAGSGPQ